VELVQIGGEEVPGSADAGGRAHDPGFDRAGFLDLVVAGEGWSCGYLSLALEQVLPDKPSCLHENSVAESGQSGSVQPSGAPIIHSTNKGLRRGAPKDFFPSSDGGGELAPIDSATIVGRSSAQCCPFGPCSLSVRALGVAMSRIFVACSKLIPPPRSTEPAPLLLPEPSGRPSRAAGVGSVRTCVGSARELRCSWLGAVRSFESLTVGVASNGEDPVAEVRGAEGCRW